MQVNKPSAIDRKGQVLLALQLLTNRRFVLATTKLTKRSFVLALFTKNARTKQSEQVQILVNKASLCFVHEDKALNRRFVRGCKYKSSICKKLLNAPTVQNRKCILGLASKTCPNPLKGVRQKQARPRFVLVRFALLQCFVL